MTAWWKKRKKMRVFYFQNLFVFSLKLAKNLPSLGWETKIKIAAALSILNFETDFKHYSGVMYIGSSDLCFNV